MESTSPSAGTQETAEYYLPGMRDIPDVGLMLEQTARLVNGYLEPIGGVSLTPSMVSNYVKHGIIARPVKKLYYRQQIADLIFIALAKTVLQLDDIRGILQLARTGQYPTDAYALFREKLIGAIGDDGGRETPGHADASILDEILRQVAVTCIHQIRLEKFVHEALAQSPQEQ